MRLIKQPETARQAFTIVELLVIVVVIGVLVMLLLPFGSRMKEKSRCTQCLNNLQKLGAAVSLYAKEHEYRIPAAERQPTNPVFPTNALPRICDVLSKYLAGSTGVLLCPNDQTGYYKREGSSYEWNYTFNSLRIDQTNSMEGNLKDLPLMYDYANVHMTPKGQTKNVLYADGHTEPL
jgi:prepilin-type processing-associated H-X9-DG protein